MKRIAETLEVARSNLVERVSGSRAKRGPQTRAGDAELTADIRRLVDGRPTLWIPADRRAHQARAIQAGLLVDEEERLVAGPAYRAAYPTGP